MSHTKGPWHVASKVRPTGARLIRDATRPPLLIAEVIDSHREHTEANALLIAAAPLMLEALENLENDDGRRMPDSAWELVQQAVEAATGHRKPSAAELRRYAHADPLRQTIRGRQVSDLVEEVDSE